MIEYSLAHLDVHVLASHLRGAVQLLSSHRLVLARALYEVIAE